MQIPSRNPLERLNAEVERRIEVVSIFSNEPATTGVVDALLRRRNCNLKDGSNSPTISPRGCPRRRAERPSFDL